MKPNTIAAKDEIPIPSLSPYADPASKRYLYLALQEDTAENTGRKKKGYNRGGSSIIAPVCMHVFTDKPDADAMYKEEVRLEEILLEAQIAWSYTGAPGIRDYETYWYRFGQESALDLDKTGLLRNHAIPESREVRRILSFLNPDTLRLALSDTVYDYLKGFKKSPGLPARDSKNILTWNAFVHTKPVRESIFSRKDPEREPVLPDLSYLSDDRLFQTPKKRVIDLGEPDMDQDAIDAVYEVLFHYDDLSYLIVPVPENREPWEVLLDILPLFSLKGIEITVPGSFIRKEVLDSLKRQKISFWAALDDSADPGLRESAVYEFIHGIMQDGRDPETEEDWKHVKRLEWLKQYGHKMDFTDSEEPDPDPNNHDVFLYSAKNPDSLAPVCRLNLMEGDYESAPFGHTEREFYMADPAFDTVLKNLQHGSRCMNAIGQTVDVVSQNNTIGQKYFYENPLKILGILYDYYDASEVRDMAYRYLSDSDKLRKRSKTL